MGVVGHGFDSLDSPLGGAVIRVDGLPHLPSMKCGEVLGGFLVLYFTRKKRFCKSVVYDFDFLLGKFRAQT
jgi:hypothetical protein